MAKFEHSKKLQNEIYNNGTMLQSMEHSSLPKLNVQIMKIEISILEFEASICTYWLLKWDIGWEPILHCDGDFIKTLFKYLRCKQSNCNHKTFSSFRPLVARFNREETVSKCRL